MSRFLVIALATLWPQLALAEQGTPPIDLDAADAAGAEAPTPDATSSATPPGDYDGEAIDPLEEELLLGGVDMDPEEEKLQIYGFSDVGARMLHSPEGSTWRTLFPKTPTFLVGNLNLYLRAQPAKNWTSLAEVRFSFAPNRSAPGRVLGTDVLGSTEVRDHADPANFIRYGSTTIERAWVEYAVNEKIQLRFGRWLTPYGIWNIDHGSPIVLGSRRPFMIGSEYVPEAQTGVQLLGRQEIDDYELRYYLTLSNGRGPTDEFQDIDGNKAVGASGKLVTPWLDEATFGFSAYYGREGDRRYVPELADPSDVTSAVTREVIDRDATELVLAADLRLRYRSWFLQAEFAADQTVYSDRGRPAHLAEPGAFAHDSFEWGVYGIAGYEFLENNTTLWASREQVVADPFNAQVYLDSLGVTFRPTPTVTLKASMGMFHVHTLAGRSRLYIPSDELYAGETQIAWVF